MTTTYTFNRGVKLRTSATRRYLVVAIAYGTARVEASTNDEEAAVALVKRYRREFPGPTVVELIDQGEALARESRSPR